MFLLEIDCGDLVLARILSLVHTVFSIICIIVPILLIVFASIQTFSMMMNPEQKNGLKKITTKFLAAIIVFLLPTITDIAMNMLPDNQFSVVACWNAADKENEKISDSDYKNWSASASSVLGDLQLLAKYAGQTSQNGGTSYDPKSCSPQYLDGGLKVPIYYQDNPNCSWGSFKDGETVAAAGCGFTSMAMILSYLTGKTVLPSTLVNSYQGGYKEEAGMGHGLPARAAKDYGLTPPSIVNAKTAEDALRNDQVVLARGANGQFSKGPHFIVLRGMDKSTGKIYVSNPAYSHFDENTQTFSMAEIDSWATKYWVFDKKKVFEQIFDAAKDQFDAANNR